jgi:hypothetical protein
VRFGPRCTKSLGLFANVFIELIPNLLCIQNILFHQGTAPIYFMKGFKPLTTIKTLGRQQTLMGSKEAWCSEVFGIFAFLAPWAKQEIPGLWYKFYILPENPSRFILLGCNQGATIWSFYHLPGTTNNIWLSVDSHTFCSYPRDSFLFTETTLFTIRGN